MSNTVQPRIYVACLASYNAGTLHGAWIDADQDADAILEEIHQILKTSPEPNVILQDFRCSATVGMPVFHRQVATRNGQEKIPCPDCDGEAVAVSEPYPSAEEWAVHDFEGFCGLNIGEYPQIETVAELAELLEEHGAPFAAYLDHLGGISELESAKDHFQDAYRGTWKSLADYAEEFTSDVNGKIPEWLENYIDYEKMGRDWEMSGDIFTVDCDEGVHIFDGTV